MTDVTVQVDEGGGGILNAFTTADAFVRDETARLVYRTGARTRTQVRANASGRPGPRVQTGDYRRSISQTNGADGPVPVSAVFTTSPQGARLEYGFNGTDSAGRSFRQPPYPHWRPAAEKIEESFTRECELMVAKALQPLTGVA